MSTWQHAYLTRFYDRSKGWIDETAELHILCEQFIVPRAGIVTIGATPSNRASRFLSRIGRLLAVGIDFKMTTNAFLEEAYINETDSFPFADCTFDACLSDFILERIVMHPSY